MPAWNERLDQKQSSAGLYISWDSIRRQPAQGQLCTSPFAPRQSLRAHLDWPTQPNISQWSASNLYGTVVELVTQISWPRTWSRQFGCQAAWIFGMERVQASCLPPIPPCEGAFRWCNDLLNGSMISQKAYFSNDTCNYTLCLPVLTEVRLKWHKLYSGKKDKLCRQENRLQAPICPHLKACNLPSAHPKFLMPPSLICLLIGTRRLTSPFPPRPFSRHHCVNVTFGTSVSIWRDSKQEVGAQTSYMCPNKGLNYLAWAVM